MQSNVSNKLEFDIKGSKVNRYVNTKHKFLQSKLNCKKVLKDMNFMEIKNDMGDLLKITDIQMKNLKDTLIEDSLFLSRYQIMDYSLLLVVESLPQTLPRKSINCSDSIEVEESMEIKDHVHEYISEK